MIVKRAIPPGRQSHDLPGGCGGQNTAGGPNVPAASPSIGVAQLGEKGRGVVALRRILRGEVIERAPVIPVPDPLWELLERTPLGDVYYLWTDDSVAVACGFGSLYNHSSSPNAHHHPCIEEDVMEYVALRDIAIGEEVCISYRCPLWFEPRP